MLGGRKIFFLFALLLLVFSMGVISLTDKQLPINLFGGKEVHSPSDWVKEEQIRVYDDRVILDIPDAIWAGFTDTNSMDPFIDEDANAIEIFPENPQSISVGDVISYKTTYGTVIHRVVEKGEDQKGFFYIVKGDNNTFTDPFKVRYDDVRGVVVAVVY